MTEASIPIISPDDRATHLAALQTLFETYEEATAEPERLYTIDFMLRNDPMTPELLAVAHEFMFGTQDVDFEDSQHMALYDTLKEVRERLEAEAREAQESQLSMKLAQARNFLTASGADPTVFTEESLLGIYASVYAQAENITQTHDETTITIDIVEDDETGLKTLPDGTILGLGEDIRERSIAEVFEYLGEKLAWLQAKQAGVVAERASWLERTSKQYDPKVNKLQRSIDWLKKSYTPLAQTHLDEMNAAIMEHNAKLAKGEIKGKQKKLVTNLKYGLVTLQLTTTKAKVIVEDDAKVIAALRALVEDGKLTEEQVERFVNTKESVQKNGFTDADKKLFLPADEESELVADKKRQPLVVPGLEFYPGGEKVASIQ